MGCWSSRFAEGSRVSVFTDTGVIRGSVLPLLASGHAFNTAVDEAPVSWDHVELRPTPTPTAATRPVRWGQRW